MKSLTPHIVFLSCALVIGARAQTERSTLVGLWQFPDRQVWVEINPDMSAFQCRIARNKVVFSSWGEVVGNATINWKENWGTDQVQATARTLTLAGEFGKFEFEKTGVPMNKVCVAVRRESRE